MLRKLALSLAVSAAFAATQANALGLGDIRVKSALNEPLNAEIQLNQVRDLNPLQIKPRMASEDDFALAGLGQSRALSDIRFQVRVNPNGSGVIQMTSREPIREPFMNFLVEVNWPSGRLVREYTVLLDPPVFDPTPTQQIVQPAAAVAPVQAAPAVKSTSASSAKAKAPVSNIRTRADKKTQTYVDVKDTLWEIAIRNRAAPDISSYQMMVALQKKNPHAFPDGNINNLKAGVVIDLPTEAEARVMSSTQAAAEVRRQTTLWKQGRASGSDKAPVDGSKPDVKRDAAESKPSDQEDNGQLKVVAPKDEAKTDEAATSDTTTAEAAKPELDEKEQLVAKNEELENRLAISQESMDRLERDNADLNEKLDAIQQQLDSLQRLIELKDQQLAALQDELRAKEAPPAPVAPPPEKNLLDKIMQTPEYLAGIGGGLIAVLVGIWVLMRRKKKAEEAAVEDDDEFNLPMGVPAAAAAASAAAMADEADEADLEALETAAEELSSAMDEQISEEDLAALGDLDDLNLDMDLDLDSDIESDLETMALEAESADVAMDSDDDDLLDSILNEQDDDATAVAVEDDEFDLGLDDFADLDDAAVELPEDAEEELDLALGDLENELDDVVAENPMDDMDDLDQLLAMDDDEPSAEEQVQQRAQRNGMGSIEAVTDSADTDDTLESLGLDGLAGLDESDSESEETLSVAQEQAADDIDDLDLEFDLDDITLPEETAIAEVPESDDAVDFESDLMADLDDILAAEDEMPAVPEESVTDDGLDFELTDEPLNVAEAVADETDEASELLPEIELDDIDAMLADIDELPAGAVDESGLLEEAADKASDFTTSANLHPDIAELLEDPVSLDEELPLAELDDTELDIAGADLDEDAPLPGTPSDAEVTEELTANIEHDLDAELDDELDSLLNSTDTDIALEETMSDEEDPLDALGLLDGADEVETKLDLARAYIDMDDIDGARDILNEIADEGNDAQKAEAKELLEGLA